LETTKDVSKGEEQENIMGAGQVSEKQAGKPTFSLEKQWNSRMALISGGKDQEPLTPKQRGQLKMLANRLGAQTKDVIDFAVKNWTKFGYKAMYSAGLNSFPDDPHIGFLLKHHHVVVATLQSIAATPKPLPPPPPPKTQIDETAVQLAKQNQKAIEEMLARFEAAGEPPPPIEYNNWGEVIHKATKKDLAALLSG
jgi:hypothetical protein